MLLAVLLVAALAWLLMSLRSPTPDSSPDSPPAASVTDPVLAALRAAEQIEDPYQRCLDYPDPREIEWPETLIEAFCADEFTPILAYRTIETRIYNQRAHEIDERLDQMVESYFRGQLPEGVLYKTFGWNFEHSNASVRHLIDDWIEQSPASAHARTALGLHLEATAAEVRGGGLLRDVSERNRKRMRDLSIQAIAELQHALAIDPRVMPAYIGIMNSAKRIGERDLVRAAYQRALNVDESGFYFRPARLHSTYRRWGGSEGETENVVRDGQEYISENPRLTNLRTIAGHMKAEDILFDEDEPDLGELMHYSEAALSHGPSWNAMDRAATTARDLGDDIRAIEFLSQMLRFTPQEHRIRRLRIGALIRVEEYDWAFAELQYLLAATPKDAWTQRRYGELLLKKGEYEDAERFFRRQLAVDLDNEWLRHNLANIYVYQMRRFDLAGPVISDWIERMPESAYARLLHLQNRKLSGQTIDRRDVEKFLELADESNPKLRKGIAESRRWLAENPDSETN